MTDKTIVTERPELSGKLCIKFIRDGEIVRYDATNLIVANGRNAMAKMLGGTTGLHVTKIGIGSGSAPAASTDTDITSGVKINILETRVGTGLEAEDGTLFDAANIVQFHFRFGKNDAVGLSLWEYGLYLADGSLFSRQVRPSAFEKTNLEQIVGFWQIQF